jgi:hypothetical protein
MVSENFIDQIKIKTLDGNQFDQILGSILEAWLVRKTNCCRFCNEKIDVKKDFKNQFCSEICKIRFEKIFDARMMFGERDIRSRGYD